MKTNIPNSTRPMGFTVCVLLLLALLSLSLQAAPFQATAIRVSVAVKGDIYTSISVGQATQLGPFDGASVFKLKGYRIVGSFIMVSSSGDALECNIDAKFNHDRTEASGTYVITGGTGRFANATGSGSYQVGSLPDGSRASFLNGTIEF